MQPLILAGSSLLVEFGARPERCGEVILFQSGDTLVSHRIVGLRRRAGRTFLLTKGDAEPFFDGLVDPGDVLGVVRAVRHREEDPPNRIGCTDSWAQRVALASACGGHLAARLRRLAGRLPQPIRIRALRAVPPLAATPTWAATTVAARRQRRHVVAHG
jgi:hypothetical protein